MSGSLFLSPMKTSDSCDISQMLEVLQSLNIVTEIISQNPLLSSYRAGEGFAQHVIYAGCSPYLKFEPEDETDTAFCHVALHAPSAIPLILTGKNTTKPRCPNCRARVEEWSLMVDAAVHPCTKCGETFSPAEYDWRQQAAIGRCFIELRNVFPSEATPSDKLMNDLKNKTGFEWRYAWAGATNAQS